MTLARELGSLAALAARRPALPRPRLGLFGHPVTIFLIDLDGRHLGFPVTLMINRQNLP
jgi:hypothetical protein